MSSNWKSWLAGSTKSRELSDTLELYARVKQTRASSPFADQHACGRFLIDLIFEICEKRGVTPSVPLGEALYRCLWDLLENEGFLLDLPDEESISRLTLEEGVALRSTLARHIRFLSDHGRLLPLWREKLVWLFSGILSYFPLSAFADVSEGGEVEEGVVLPEAHAYALCDNLPECLDRIIITFCDDDVVKARLFESIRQRFEDNLCLVSGVSPERRNDTSANLVSARENTKASPAYLVAAYLQGTPLRDFFESLLPFAIPFPARFEHTHVVGGTGHGKTQLLQFLIHHDLMKSLEDHRSVVVIDSQGDLLRTISHLGCFSPNAERSLADRFVLVDPHDIEYPVCLNMFDFNRSRLSGYAPVDREKILNATVELYEYFFGALLGAELTQRQGLIFKYLARLLIEIPNATIHTLRELMEDGERFRPYMEKLSGTARSFFATRFFDRGFNETKKQILTRLWGVLSNTSLERMFSHTENKIDVFELLNQGKVVLINTAKDLLGQEGTAIFGRFFIALIAQAAVQRAVLQPHERNPAFVYLDEAQDYFDDNISQLLHQARKYRVGLVFAHQNLDQLSTDLRASVLSSTSIKFAGGVSAKDARVLDDEFRTSADFLLSQRKERNHTEFACHVRNYTTSALSVSIPLGYVESQPILSVSEYQHLVDENRARYSAPPVMPEDVPFPEVRAGKQQEKERARKEEQPVSPGPATRTSSNTEPRPAPQMQAPSSPEPAREEKRKPRETVHPPEEGRGGRQHKYLQHLVKQLAEERGFRATIEESILNGAGQVDVALIREKRRIAVEISVTTGKDQELQNIEKCLAAGYVEVVLVGATERHVKSLSRFIQENLEEGERGKVRYLAPEGLMEYLGSLGEPPAPTEQVVRGYKVKTTRQTVDPKDAELRRQAIAGVIARSMSKK